ncbi:MAG TPA: hypothetical protein VGC55_16475 [Dokdonella sp.]
MTEAYGERQAALFDRLREDSSPRQQILVGHIYLGNDDAVPTALRPKREDVVARAVQLAPDDAFVQWQGASLGSYTSSRCGPTTWPDAEVANLIRLQPDNAAAWQYAVALAAAKGDQAGIDEALSRMAAAPRADDHLVEQLNEWKKTYAAQPDMMPMRARAWKDAPPEARTLFSALQQVSADYSPAKSTLLETCKPDASSDRAWQRLGWCADAAHTLASKGGSLALREQGLELLGAIGEHGDAIDSLQRQYDWYEAHAANPMRNFEVMSERPQDVAADWQGANTEIDAIERRLKRTGQPLQAPAGWLKEAPADESDVDAGAAMTAYRNYLKSLVDAMRASGDVHQQALAAGSGSALALITDEDHSDPSKSTENSAPKADSIGVIAAAHPDDLLVQWVAAHASGADVGAEAKAAAIADTERLDSGNAAALGLSLAASAGDAAQTDAILQRMAASGRYDEHTGEIFGVWLDAVRRTPPPAELVGTLREMGAAGTATDNDSAAQGIAMMMAYSSSIGSQTTQDSLCASKDTAEAARRKDNCIALARLQLHSGTSLVATMLGESRLHALDAMDARDAGRARQLAWWRESLMPTFSSGGAALDRYFDDIRRVGDVEALRLAAARLGTEEPAADWKSPAEKWAAKKARRAR